MATFIKTPEGAYFLKNDSGLEIVKDPTTYQGLQSGSIPYETQNFGSAFTSQPTQPSLSSVSIPRPQAIQSQEPVNDQDPLTKFNLTILDMLKSAQGVDSKNLYEQQRLLQRTAIDRAGAPTPEELRVLSPGQQSAIRSGSVQALEPEIDAVATSIKAQDQRLANFERLLSTAKDFGAEFMKNVAPSKEIIEGYRQMIRAGAQPTSIPDEVRNKVLSSLTPDDWSAWSEQNRKGVEDDAYLKVLSQQLGGDKPPTESERRAFGFYERAKDAEQSLATVEEKIAQLGIGGQTRLKFAPSILQTDDGKMFQQAKRQFVEAYLRKDSGAQISDQEFSRADLAYFAQPGDTPELLERKRAARQQILQSLQKEAGRAYSQSYGQPGQVQGTTESRPNRNNNPFNIKLGSLTQKYVSQGLATLDPSPAQDGGQFLTFKSLADGFKAGHELITSSRYRNLTVDKALRDWSNNGYSGEIVRGKGVDPAAFIRDLPEDQMKILLKIMAQQEGFTQ